jgi:hypothetical protein
MSNRFYNIADKIDKLVKKYSPENLAEIEKFFVEKGLEYYFFSKKLMEVERPVVWLIPLKEKGYFEGRRNPPPQEVKGQPGSFTLPFWNVLPYLERVAKINKENPSDDITNGLAEIIDSIINYRDKNSKRIENYRTDWFVTKIIFMLPYKIWRQEHIDFIGTAIREPFGGSLIQSKISKTVLPALIENKAVDLILKLLEVILDFTKAPDDKWEKIKPLMDKPWLSDALKKFNKQISELCGLEAAKISITTIKKVLQEDENRFSYIMMPTIEDSDQNQFPDRYDCQLVFFVRDMFENSKPEEIKDTIKELLTEDNSILKRIAIHTINRHYNDFKDLFWNWNGNPLNERGCMHELFQLLKENCSQFSKEQINKVLEWIESKDYVHRDEEHKEQVLAYMKKEWLSTLLDTKDPNVISKYNEYGKKSPYPLEHPGSLIWHEEGAWGHISPIQPNELLEKSNEEIAEYLRTWKEEDGWKKPSMDGLSDSLKQGVKQNPEKFTKNLKPFLKVPSVYQDSILRGFRETEKQNEIAWKEVFGFISEIISSNDFWAEEYEKQSYNYRNWIISAIADLIEKGANYEGNVFGDELLPEIEKILLILADKAKAETPQNKRLIDHLLNSTKGKIFSAIIHYCLCYSRLKKEKEIRWPEAIKQDFTRRLNKSIETSIDYSGTLGMYLGTLLYLDQKWVLDNIEKIFPKEDSTHWNAAFEGYLSYSPHVYEETYQLLKKNGHYAEALEVEFSDDYVQEKLVQHICVGFLANWEKLDDPASLISLILKKGKTKHLSEIVHFLWGVKDEKTSNKVKEKIRPLWKTLFEILEKKQADRNYQLVISEFYMWFDIIDEIDDEIASWVKLTAKYINVGFHDSELVENLAKHVEKRPKNVGEIYIEMLNGGAYPDYDQENIKKIVECLYSSGFKDYADTICNMYAEVGYYFLREIYEKYNN